MPKPFCKIFDHPQYGQILVVLDTNDQNNPAIEVKADFDDLGLGVCGLTFAAKEETDETWAEKEKEFSETTFEKATKVIETLRKMITEKLGPLPEKFPGDVIVSKGDDNG